MKKFLLAFFLLLVLAGAGAVWFVFGDYSDGYRMGTLTSFERDGYVPFLKSGEGQILLGRESSPLALDYKTSDGYLVPKTFNPWRFSANQGDIPRYERLAGRQVWVRYRQHRYNLSPLRETEYEVEDADEVGGAAPAPPSFEIEKPATLGRSEGVRSGRIVKVSAKGHLIDTWEIVLQVGDAGNHFKPMSVDDRAMYDYAVKCLKSGRPVLVRYVDKGVLKFDFNDTPYEVWKIEAQ